LLVTICIEIFWVWTIFAGNQYLLYLYTDSSAAAF